MQVSEEDTNIKTKPPTNNTKIPNNNTETPKNNTFNDTYDD